MTRWEIVPAGERGYFLRLAATRPSVSANGALHGLAGRLREELDRAATAVIVSYATLYLEFDPERVARRRAEDLLRSLAGSALAGRPARRGGMRPRIVHLPVRYGGEHGPDLDAVAAETGLSPEELVARHAGRSYHAFCLGFSPGFAYLGWLPAELEVRRLSEPRTHVPAGSVAIAGRQTAVYPSPTPGGWRLIGRSPIAMYRPWDAPPVRVMPGDRVRFIPVDDDAFARIEEEEARGRERAAAAPRSPSPRPDGEGTIEVLEAGLLTTVQDLGRFDWRGLGFPVSGALDRAALRLANRLVGNEEGAAGLEITLRGPVLRFMGARVFALAGADLSAELDGVPLRPGEAGRARPGQILRFGARRSGLRTYLAVAGGIAVPEVGGSRSTDLVAGLGGYHGRALRAGDRLPLADSREERRSPGEDGGARRAASPPSPSPLSGAARPHAPLVVRVVPGPDLEQAGAGALAALVGSRWTVAPASNRMGLRLAGPRIALADSREMLSEPVPPGSVQVTAGGIPMVILADGQSIGGYPKIAVVADADRDLLAQALPGEILHFEVPGNRIQ